MMKTILLVLLFAIIIPFKTASYAQDTVVSVAFMTRDKNLWPEYRANKTSLDRLANFLKRNPDARVYLNVACASHGTTAENLATARERLTAVRSQMAQRFSLDQYLKTSKISTVPVAGRTDIAVIVVKTPQPETTTAPQTQHQTLIAQTTTKDTVAPKPAEEKPKPQPVQKIEPTTEPVVAQKTIEEKPTKPVEEKPVIALTPAIIESPEEEPIVFTPDEIRTLINQADSFVEAPEFNIPISQSAPKEFPKQTPKPNTYTRESNILPPVKYFNGVEQKKSRGKRK